MLTCIFPSFDILAVTVSTAGVLALMLLYCCGSVILLLKPLRVSHFFPQAFAVDMAGETTLSTKMARIESRERAILDTQNGNHLEAVRNLLV